MYVPHIQQSGTKYPTGQFRKFTCMTGDLLNNKYMISTGVISSPIPYFFHCGMHSLQSYCTEILKLEWKHNSFISIACVATFTQQIKSLKFILTYGKGKIYTHKILTNAGILFVLSRWFSPNRHWTDLV